MLDAQFLWFSSKIKKNRLNADDTVQSRLASMCSPIELIALTPV